jgi:hypothetical protein
MAISDDFEIDPAGKTIRFTIASSGQTGTVMQFANWLSNIFNNEDNIPNRTETAALLAKWLDDSLPNHKAEAVGNGCDVQIKQKGRWPLTIWVRPDATTVEVTTNDNAKIFDLHEPNSTEDMLQMLKDALEA